MATLAIKGHPTRGNEVIQLLEMLGGKIRHDRLAGNEIFSWYYINGDGFINYMHYSLFYDYDTMVFNLEEFEEKFPYKVGDIVKCYNIWEGIIESMEWYEGEVLYHVRHNSNNYLTPEAVENLQPYKEETMEGVYTYNEINCYHQDFGDKVRIRLGNDFEIKVEDNITYIVKKQPQYPKTYEECCEVLGFSLGDNIDNLEGYKSNLLEYLQGLLICRDAYWKIAGEQMGLGKPWEPDWIIYEQKYCLGTDKNRVIKKCVTTGNKILAFPTEEMRDVFYENFKKLIEQCKELL